MAETNYADMGIDELVARSVELKRQGEAIRAERQAIKAELDRKVWHQNAKEALERVGLDGVVVIPETAHLSARGN